MNGGSYGAEIVRYLHSARQAAETAKLTLDFTAADTAAKRFEDAGTAVHPAQAKQPADPHFFNQSLRSAESALLSPQGLPQRPWFKHTIYAPGEFTGYAAVVIPGVNEAIEAPDGARAQAQIVILAEALNRSATILENAARAGN